MHFVRKNSINNNVSIFEDTLGGCERLLSSPVPLFYSRHTARFLSTWLLALPFGLYAPFANSWNHCMMIPATAFVSVCLFGIEELATQLEVSIAVINTTTYQYLHRYTSGNANYMFQIMSTGTLYYSPHARIL